MSARTDAFDLGPLHLRAGEARHLDLEVPLDHFELSNERYDVRPTPIPIHLDASKMTGGGWSLRLRLRAELHGPCMRCLEPASPAFEVDAYEVDQPGGGEELDSPYVEGEVVDVAAWTRDALALELPGQHPLPARLPRALPRVRHRPQQRRSRAPPREGARPALGGAVGAQAGQLSGRAAARAQSVLT